MRSSATVGLHLIMICLMDKDAFWVSRGGSWDVKGNVLRNALQKITIDGQPFITIYFEKPTKKTKSGFKSAQVNYPDGKFKNVIGYKERGIKKLQALVDTYSDIAYDMAVEDSQNA